MVRIGIMQGRLSNRSGGRLQAFPRADWRGEFERAATLGFDFIEWLFEAAEADSNPLVSAQGRRQIREVTAQTGIPVGSVCAPYFMHHRLSGGPAAAVTARLRELIAATAEVGARRLLLPWLEESHLATREQEDDAVETLRGCLEVAERHDVVVALEMEIRGAEYARVVQRLGHSHVGACYDTGNSTAAGRRIATDVRPLLHLLAAVHLKDRMVAGESRRLGDGDVDFTAFFAALRASGFAGDFVLEHWYIDPVADARHALSFVRRGLAAAGYDVP
jgi:hexulose-6-phosphate isomerase